MPTNVFPNHSVAPLCAGKIYTLYRMPGSNAYTLTIKSNDEILAIVDKETELDTLTHILNEIKTYQTVYGYSYVIRLNLDITEMDIDTFKYLYRALIQHNNDMDVYIYNAIGYGAILATLGRSKTMQIDGAYELCISKKDITRNPKIVELIKNQFARYLNELALSGEKWEDDIFYLGITFTIEDLCKHNLIDYVDAYDRIYSSK